MKKLLLIMTIILMSACSATKTTNVLQLAPSDSELKDGVKKITSTCRRFAKNYRSENHDLTELETFNNCMHKARPIIGKTNEVYVTEE